MLDSWEDLAEGALDEELEVLESMYPDEYEKKGERVVCLRLNLDGTSGKVPCILEFDVPEDYPSAPPKSSISIELKDHLAKQKLELACESHLKVAAEERAGSSCLSELIDIFVEAIRDPSAMVLAEEVSTAYTRQTSNRSSDVFSTMPSEPQDDTEEDEEDDEPPPGEIVRCDAEYKSRAGGMQGFSAKTFAFMNCELGFRTADGSCVTMGNHRSRHAKWGLLGDGPLNYAELEVGKVRTGHKIDLMIGVTAAAPKKIDLLWHHQIADTIQVALDCQAPRLSLGYRDGEMFAFSDDLPQKGSTLKAGDRLGVWYTNGELRIVHNSRPLMRVRANLGNSVTLMVILMGRVVQLQMHVPETIPDVPFEGLVLEGREQSRVGEWMESDDCKKLRPLW